MTQRQKKTKERKRKGIVARATDTAEEIHRAVAGFPLDVLENVDRLAKPVARIRKLQDRSITTTYEMVRGVNRELALLIRGRPARKAAPKPRVVAKARAHREPKSRAAAVRPTQPTAVAT